MSLKLVIMMSVLVSQTFQVCLQPSQKDGKCSSCIKSDVLISGRCIKKVQGCSIQTEQSKCVKCFEAQYLLENGKCVKQASLQNTNKINNIKLREIEIKKNQNLVFNDLKTRIDSKYLNSFSVAHGSVYFYQTLLYSGYKITKVVYIDCQLGTYFYVLYQLTTNASVYQAISLTNQDSKFKLVTFSPYSPKISQNNPLQIAGTKLPSLLSILTSCKLQQIVKTTSPSNSYNYYYLTNDQIIIKLVVPQKNNDETFVTKNMKFQFKKYSFSDYVLEKVIMEYPQYGNSRVEVVQRGDGYYGFKIGANNASLGNGKGNGRNDRYLGVSMQSIGNVSVTNMTTQPPLSTGLPSIIKTTEPFVGGYQLLQQKQLSNPTVLQILTKIRQRIPQLKTTTIQNAYMQIVQGINYKINFRSQDNRYSYEVKAYYSLNRQLIVSYVLKNGDILYREYKPFDQDLKSIRCYEEFKNKIKDNVEMPSVRNISVFKSDDNVHVYKIFMKEQWQAKYQCIGSVDDESVNVEILELYNKGNDVLSQLRIDEADNPAIKGQYINLLSKNLDKFGAKRIEQLLIVSVIPSKQQKSWTMTIISPLGIYTPSMTISSLNPPIISLSLTSSQPQTCLSLQKSYISKLPNLNKLYATIVQYYYLKRYQLKRLMLKIVDNQILYRLLFQTSFLGKFDIFVRQGFDFGGFVVGFAGALERGFEIVNASNLEYKGYYEDMVKLKNQLNWSISDEPFYTETNSTFTQSFLSQRRSLYLITYNRQNNKVSLSIVTNSTIFNLPKQMQFTRLLYPGITNLDINRTVNRIINQIRRKYIQLQQCIVLSVSRDEQSGYYILFINSTKLGFVVVKGKSPSDDVLVELLPYRKLNITTENITNCINYIDNLDAFTGECLTCSSKGLYQFQGSCYEKISNCERQIGRDCYKCQTGYINIESKCVGDCESLFKYYYK